MPVIVISDSKLDKEDEQGHNEDDALPPFLRSPEPAHAGPSDHRGLFNIERLTRGFEQAERAHQNEVRFERRGRCVMDDNENNPYGPLF